MKQTGARCRWRGLLAMALSLAALLPGIAAAAGLGDGAVGSGDGRIHIIPTLSHASIKNGEPLSVQAIVTTDAGVASVEAVIDTENGYAYFGTHTSPGRVVKVTLARTTTRLPAWPQSPWKPAKTVPRAR